MKKLLVFLLAMHLFVFANSQFVYKIKADSLLVTNDSCNTEFILENSTKHVPGFLFNKGRGRTEFRSILQKLNDSLYLVGGDSLNMVSSQLYWKTIGNNGTNGTNNFLGTTDNQSLNFRVNNTQKFQIGQANTVGSFNISHITAGDLTSTSSNPIQLTVNGKDISGSLLPFAVNASIEGMLWNPSGGSNNTMGRLMRFAQWTNSTTNKFFDAGIDEEGDFYFTEQNVSGGGGYSPMKMFQITSDNYIGLNMSWSENPTANLHTKGTVRHDGAVAIGDAPNSSNIFMVSLMDSTVDGRAIARFKSNDTWQTNFRMDNTTVDKSYSFVVGGVNNNFTNYGVGVGNFGIVRSNQNGLNTTIPFIIDSASRVGISSTIGGTTYLPKAALDVNSTSSGILIPRLTTVQRNNIASGNLHNGLLIYNSTSSRFQFYNGSAWLNIMDSASHASSTPNYTVQSLTDGSTVTWNVTNGINGVLTLAGTNRTLSITNAVAGQTYTIRIIQDGAGGRTIGTWPTNSKWPNGVPPTLSSMPGRYDLVVFYFDGTNFYGTYQPNFQ